MGGDIGGMGGGEPERGICMRKMAEQGPLLTVFRRGGTVPAPHNTLTLRGAMPRETAARQPLCADIDGFSLHAAVRVEAHDRKRLEQLCRYITRPALSDERVQLNAAGQVELKLKTPWRDGTTHLVMSPLEFMQRLAALVPRPRLHLIRFGVRITSLREVSGPPLREHGVPAPNAKLLPLVVPQGPEVEEQATEAQLPANARPRRFRTRRPSQAPHASTRAALPSCSRGGAVRLSGPMPHDSVQA